VVPKLPPLGLPTAVNSHCRHIRMARILIRRHRPCNKVRMATPHKSASSTLRIVFHTQPMSNKLLVVSHNPLLSYNRVVSRNHKATNSHPATHHQQAFRNQLYHNTVNTLLIFNKPILLLEQVLVNLFSLNLLATKDLSHR
jgi:hypothetical protein